jgi:radical SAM superfamily enzyme YgiQ (UPF0313 family)
MAIHQRYDAYIGIHPRSDVAGISSQHITVPLGALAIASRVARDFPETTVKVFYGELTDEITIYEEVKTLLNEKRKPLVGITLVAGNTTTALGMASHFDDIGIDVILGGPEAWLSYNEYGDEFLKDKPYIRALCFGAGEHIISSFVKYGLDTCLPNLVYRQNPHDDLVSGPTVPTDLDFERLSIDYALLEGIEQAGGVSYIWRSDCHMARGKRCYFCGRINLGYGTRDPRNVWDELVLVHKKWGLTTYYNVADSIAINQNDLKRFVDAKPEDLSETVHRCFINPHQVNCFTAGCLKKLNAIAALGIESFDLLDTIGKFPSSNESNMQAIDLLNKQKVPMILSFVLGLPGETAQTAINTLKRIESLIQEYPFIVGIEISPLTITVGSRAYHDLMERAKKRYRHIYPPYDIVKMSTDYFDAVCNINRNSTIELIKEYTNSIVAIKPDLCVDIKGISQEESVRLFTGITFANFNQLYEKVMMVH